MPSDPAEPFHTSRRRRGLQTYDALERERDETPLCQSLSDVGVQADYQTGTLTITVQSVDA